MIVPATGLTIASLAAGMGFDDADSLRPGF